MLKKTFKSGHTNQAYVGIKLNQSSDMLQFQNYFNFQGVMHFGVLGWLEFSSCIEHKVIPSKLDCSTLLESWLKES